jgi:hypothetical protein
VVAVLTMKGEWRRWLGPIPAGEAASGDGAWTTGGGGVRGGDEVPSVADFCAAW